MKTTEGVFDCGDLKLQRGGALKGAQHARLVGAGTPLLSNPEPVTR